jgi:NADH:ubiquinone oxidoreductase subunit E
MDEKTDIVICLGSSCFSRGNRKSLYIISEYLKEHQLEDQVFFHGQRCFGSCEKGPMLKIADKIFDHVEPGNVKDILDGFFIKNSNVRK